MEITTDFYNDLYIAIPITEEIDNVREEVWKQIIQTDAI